MSALTLELACAQVDLLFAHACHDSEAAVRAAESIQRCRDELKRRADERAAYLAANPVPPSIPTPKQDPYGTRPGHVDYWN